VFCPDLIFLYLFCLFLNSSTSAMHDILPAVGDKVKFALSDGTLVQGTVQFFGQTSFAPGIDWAGIFLDTPNGKNDGSVQNIRYFTCPMSYGIFCKPNQLTHQIHTPTPGLVRASSSMTDGGGVDAKAICSILKIKIAKSLEMINDDMKLLDMLNMSDGSSAKISAEEYDKILTQLSVVAGDGVNHLQTFKNDIDKLNSF
jgi:dynactin complex subunit